MASYRKTLLTNPGEIKSSTLLNYNIDDAYLNYTCMNAQELYLEEITGTKLYRRLQELVYNEANRAEGDKIYDSSMSDYNDLLQEYIKPFLNARCTVDMLYAVSYKIRNAGVVRTSDTNIENASMDDIRDLERQYMTYSDAWSQKLSMYLKENKDKFPELDDEVSGDEVKPNDGRPYGNCGIWLGNDNGGC